MLVPTLQHCVGSAPAPLHHGHPFFFFPCLFFQTRCCPLNPILQKTVSSQPAAVMLLTHNYPSLPSGALNASPEPGWQCFSASFPKQGGARGCFFFFERGWGKKDGDPYIISSFSYSEVAAQRERCFAKAFRYNIV